MKRFILILAVVLLLATVIAPAALAAANNTIAHDSGPLARPSVMCPDRMCPDGFGGKCSCGGVGNWPLPSLE